MVNNVSNNIDEVVNDSIKVDNGSIPMNNEVHDGSASVNEGVTKDASFSLKKVWQEVKDDNWWQKYSNKYFYCSLRQHIFPLWEKYVEVEVFVSQ